MKRIRNTKMYQEGSNLLFQTWGRKHLTGPVVVLESLSISAEEMAKLLMWYDAMQKLSWWDRLRGRFPKIDIHVDRTLVEQDVNTMLG